MLLALGALGNVGEHCACAVERLLIANELHLSQPRKITETAAFECLWSIIYTHVHKTLTYETLTTSVCGLKIIGYEALSY